MLCRGPYELIMALLGQLVELVTKSIRKVRVLFSKLQSVGIELGLHFQRRGVEERGHLALKFSSLPFPSRRPSLFE